MGRMADARKRARRGQTPPELPVAPDAAEASAPVEAQPAPEAPEAGTPGAEPGLEAPTEWLARDEVMTFPAEPESETVLAPATPMLPSERLTLPSSGLAQDILRSLDVPDAPLPAQEAVESEPAPAATRSHSLSFFGAPMREEHQALEATEHLVTFLLASEEYGVDVRLVQEIIRVSSITPVPRAPEFIKGVINLRGRIIPVVDLKRKLELGSVDESGKRARIVVVRLRDRLIGVLVDGASQVLKVPLSVIEAAPEEVVSISQSFIRGVAKLEKRLIILVALQEILLPALREAAAGAEA